jgi:hypothetical protein
VCCQIDELEQVNRTFSRSESSLSSALTNSQHAVKQLQSIVQRSQQSEESLRAEVQLLQLKTQQSHSSSEVLKQQLEALQQELAEKQAVQDSMPGSERLLQVCCTCTHCWLNCPGARPYVTVTHIIAVRAAAIHGTYRPPEWPLPTACGAAFYQSRGSIVCCFGC